MVFPLTVRWHLPCAGAYSKGYSSRRPIPNLSSPTRILPGKRRGFSLEGHRRPQIRMPEIVALPQHRLPLLARQRIGEAVAEVQPGRVAAAFAKVAVGLPGNLRLRGRHRLDDDPGVFYDLVEAGAQPGISVPIGHDGCLKIRPCGDAEKISG